MYPVIFRLGGLSIYSYGLMLGIAFLAGTWLASREAGRKDIDPKIVWDFSFYFIIYAIIGARIYYILFYDLDRYLTEPLSMFAIWRGGLAVHGGVIGGLIYGAYFTKKRRISFTKFADTLTPSFILAQAIGRVGCLLNGCCYGTPSALPWAIDGRHPTQIYHMLANLGIFVIIWNIRKRFRSDGLLFFTYLILYSVMRFMIEFFRADSLYLWNTDLKSAQAISILIVTISIFFIFKKLRKNT